MVQVTWESRFTRPAIVLDCWSQPRNIRITIPQPYRNAVAAIHTATNRAVGFNVLIKMPDAKIPNPMTRMPATPAIMLAFDAVSWN